MSPRPIPAREPRGVLHQLVIPAVSVFRLDRDRGARHAGHDHDARDDGVRPGAPRPTICFRLIRRDGIRVMAERTLPGVSRCDRWSDWR